MLTCPLCGKDNLKNILAHYKIHVRDITKESFLKLYPDWNQPFQYDLRKHENHKCPYCDKTFLYNNTLSVHIKALHKEEWERIKSEQSIKEKAKQELKGQLCQICNAIKIDLKQHIERFHNIDWDDYCNKYNHDHKLTKIVDDNYRQLLSQNKKKFYNETERGKLLKRKQSENWKGNKNIVYKPEIIEKSIHTRSINGLIPNISTRSIHCWYKTINKTTRSYEELKFIILLEMNNISFKYEPGFVIKYWNNEKQFVTSYLPDFYINGKYYELKVPKERDKILNNIETTKYYEIMKAFNKLNIDFSIISINNFAEENGILVDYSDIDKMIQSKYNSEEIRFTCHANSNIIKHITGCSNLQIARGVTLYG